MCVAVVVGRVRVQCSREDFSCSGSGGLAPTTLLAHTPYYPHSRPLCLAAAWVCSGVFLACSCVPSSPSFPRFFPPYVSLMAAGLFCVGILHTFFPARALCTAPLGCYLSPVRLYTLRAAGRGRVFITLYIPLLLFECILCICHTVFKFSARVPYFGGMLVVHAFFIDRLLTLRRLALRPAGGAVIPLNPAGWRFQKIARWLAPLISRCRPTLIGAAQQPT